MQNNDKNRTERWFNANRTTYLANDGVTYYGKVIDQKTGEEKTLQICRIGENGVTEADIDLLLEMDEIEDNNEFNNRRLIDFSFEKAKDFYSENPDAFEEDPLNMLIAREPSIHEQAFPDDKPSNQFEADLHRVVTEMLEPQQQKLFDQHITHGLSFKEIQTIEKAETGKLVSTSGISKRWDKAFSKICKGLGVEKPRRRALSERQQAELEKQ